MSAAEEQRRAGAEAADESCGTVPFRCRCRRTLSSISDEDTARGKQQAAGSDRPCALRAMRFALRIGPDALRHVLCAARKGRGTMKAIVDLCVVPLGVGVSVSEYVVACERVVKKAGLKSQLHSYGTNIEGEWDAVFAAIKKCHETVHAMGAPRISTVIKVGTRTDRDQTMDDKVRSVQSKLNR